MKALELDAEVDEQHHLNVVLPADARPGPVRVIVLIPETIDSSTPAESSPLLELVERCQIHTGIGDMAHQHDHYLYGKPKKSD